MYKKNKVYTLTYHGYVYTKKKKVNDVNHSDSLLL